MVGGGGVGVVVLIIVTIATTTAAAPLSFNYKNTEQICSDAAVKLYGDASCGSSGVQLTPFDYWDTGQARHPNPMHLWDDKSTTAGGGESLANFTTEFTFTIDNNNGEWTCDGLAFFLAPHDYVAPDHSSDGRLGLVHSNFTYNSTAAGSRAAAFVAVEFDTYNNGWDTWHDGLNHVGIDLDSMKSAASKRWRSHVDGNTTMWAKVSYQAKKKKLCVVYSTTVKEEVVNDTLCYGVDLRDYLPEWVVVGFSASTAFRYQSHTVKSWSFSSDLDGDYQTYITTAAATATTTTTLLFPAIAILLITIAIALWARARVFNTKLHHYHHLQPENKNKEKQQEDLSGIPLIERHRDRSSKHVIDEGVKLVPLQELKRATNEFSEELGRGGFGVVYKGQLQSGGQQLIAVKKIHLESVGMEGFVSELAIITQLSHKHLVRLLGWSNDLETSSYYLIYEYMENRSLDLHLFGDGNGTRTLSTLDWEKRYRIAKGVASALSYLQAGSSNGNCVLHGDVKSSNVLLDAEFNPKLGDFGLARVVDREMRSHAEHGGTPAYMAPERANQRRSGLESDTYSFGVVALELACGRRAAELNEHIVEWVWGVYGRGDLFEAVDGRLEGRFDREEMRRLLVVGICCAHRNRERRLSIQEAVRLLSDMKAPLPRNLMRL